MAFADAAIRNTRRRLETLRAAAPLTPSDPVPHTPAARPERGLGEPA